jgi:uncharacterized protein YecT (DUF1311 family)
MLKKVSVIFAGLLAASAAHATPEYDACYGQAIDDDATAECMKAETERLMKDIQQKYITISQMPTADRWNNGDGLKRGNLRDMYNSWLGYRNRICSLNKALSTNGYYTPAFHEESCRLDMTQEHLKYISAVLTTALSSRDDDQLNDQDLAE